MLFETSLYNDPDKAARSSREKMPLILAEFLVDAVNPLHGSLFDPCCDTSGLLSAPEAFDYILLNPPFHYDKDHGYLDGKFMLDSMARLKPAGRCGCIVSEGLLGRCNSQDIDVRKRLLTEFNLHTILLLPANAFPTAKVHTSILIFTNEPPDKKDIQLIDIRENCITNAVMDEALTVINDPFAKNTLPLYQLPKAKIKPPQYILSPDRYITKVRGNIFSKLDANTKSQVLPKNRLEYTLQELDISFNTQFSKTQFPRKLGKELFVVKNGQPVPKNYHGGTNPVYNGNGICNYINCANLSAPLPTIIINRVGDHCGRVHIADTTCYIADNAMYISEFKADFDIIFLFFLFRNLNLNGLKGGTGAPSIRQDAIYDTEFMLPPLQEQQAFSDSIREEMRYVNEMIVEQAQIYRQEVLF